MMLMDVNLLVYAVFKDSAHHEITREWLDATLSGTEPMALPRVVPMGFIRISTNPRIMSVPLTLDEAIGYVDE